MQPVDSTDHETIEEPVKTSEPITEEPVKEIAEEQELATEPTTTETTTTKEVSEPVEQSTTEVNGENGAELQIDDHIHSDANVVPIQFVAGNTAINGVDTEGYSFQYLDRNGFVPRDRMQELLGLP